MEPETIAFDKPLGEVFRNLDAYTVDSDSLIDRILSSYYLDKIDTEAELAGVTVECTFSRDEMAPLDHHRNSPQQIVVRFHYNPYPKNSNLYNEICIYDQLDLDLDRHPDGIVLESCLVMGDVHIHGTRNVPVRIIGTIVTGSVYIQGIETSDQLTISRSLIGGGLSIIGCQIKGIDLQYTAAHGPVSIRGTVTAGTADLRCLRSSGNISISWSVFHGSIEATLSKAMKKFEIDTSKVDSAVIATYCRAKAIILDLTAGSLLDLGYSVSPTCSISGKMDSINISLVSIQTIKLNFLVIENASFFWNRDGNSSCTFRAVRFKDAASFQGFRTATLRNVDFSDLNVYSATEIIHLQKVRISGRLRYSSQFDPIAAINYINNLEERQAALHDLYTYLKDAKDFETADRSLIAYKDCRRDAILDSAKDLGRFGRLRAHIRCLPLTLQKLTSRYGTSWPLVGIWILAVMLLSAMVYWAVLAYQPGWFNVSYDGDWDPLYFSVITALTIGYGDIVPLNGGMRILVCAEGAVEVILTSYMMSILVHHVLRD